MEAGGGQEPQQMSEEEIRAKLEEELRQVRIEDLLMQSVAGVVNLTARRIAKEDERDLDQAKKGIDATNALVEFLPREAADQVRNAVSELQMLYARAAAGKPLTGEEPPAEQPPQGSQEGAGLWTPPGS